MRRVALGLVLAVAACGQRAEHDRPSPIAPPGATGSAASGASGSAIATGLAPLPVLPPAPPLPPVPVALPSQPDRAPGERTAAVTPETVALGALLFGDVRLSAGGATACATCHDPEHGFSGPASSLAANGKPNLRHAPALVNLAWGLSYGWDGRYPTLLDQLAAHVIGQLGRRGEPLVAGVAADPLVRAHFARVDHGAAPSALVALGALAAYVLTRYAGDSTWDRAERGSSAGAPDPTLAAGYQLFNGKAQCSVCHTPPLYTDLGYHAIGLVRTPDEGRARVDSDAPGAFRTPTLRDAALRTAFFHDGSAATLEAAIAWHLAGGTGQGAATSIIDPALAPVTLAPGELAALTAFVRALSRDPQPPAPGATPAPGSPVAPGSR